jgi:hypothetical protein
MKKTTTKTKRIRYTPATDVTLARAYLRAARVYEKDPAVCSTEQDAGFLIIPGDRGAPKKGFQVFVKVCRYDESLLRKRPMSGGLLVNDRGVSISGG